MSSGFPSVAQWPALLARCLIRGYKLGLAPVLPAACRFEPTCSDYASQAIGRFGLIRGGSLALRRLVRCHPWGGLGYDPVPDPDSSTSTLDGARSEHACSANPCPPLA